MGHHEGARADLAPEHARARQTNARAVNIPRYMQRGIDKLTAILQNNEDASFTAEEYMSQYTAIYNMCTQRAPHEYSEQLYNRYKDAFVSYLRDLVRSSSRAVSQHGWPFELHIATPSLLSHTACCSFTYGLWADVLAIGVNTFLCCRFCPSLSLKRAGHTC